MWLQMKTTTGMSNILQKLSAQVMDTFLKINKQNNLKIPQVVPTSRSAAFQADQSTLLYLLKISEWTKISEADAHLQVLVLVCSTAIFCTPIGCSHLLSHLYGNHIPVAEHLRHTPEEHPAPSHPTLTALTDCWAWSPLVPHYFETLWDTLV